MIKKCVLFAFVFGLVLQANLQAFGQGAENSCVPIFEKLTPLNSRYGTLSSTESIFLDSKENKKDPFAVDIIRYIARCSQETQAPGCSNIPQLKKGFDLKDKFVTSFMSQPVAVSTDGRTAIIQKGTHEFEWVELAHPVKIIKKFELNDFATQFAWDLENKKFIGQTIDGKVLLMDMVTGQKKTIALKSPDVVRNVALYDKQSFIIQTTTGFGGPEKYFRIFPNGKLSRLDSKAEEAYKSKISGWKEWSENQFLVANSISKSASSEDQKDESSYSSVFKKSKWEVNPSHFVKISENKYLYVDGPLSTSNDSSGVRIFETNKSPQTVLEKAVVINILHKEGENVLLETMTGGKKEYLKFNVLHDQLEKIPSPPKAINMHLTATGKQYIYHLPSGLKTVWGNLNTAEERDWNVTYPDLYPIETLTELSTKKFIVRTSGGRVHWVSFEDTPTRSIVLGGLKDFVVAKNNETIWIKNKNEVQLLSSSGVVLRNIPLEFQIHEMLAVKTKSGGEVWLFDKEGKKVIRYAEQTGEKLGEILTSSDKLEINGIRLTPHNDRILIVFVGGKVKSVDLNTMSVKDVFSSALTSGGLPSSNESLLSINHSKQGQYSIFNFSSGKSYLVNWKTSQSIKLSFEGSKKNEWMEFCPNETCVLFQNEKSGDYFVLTTQNPILQPSADINYKSISGLPSEVKEVQLKRIGWDITAPASSLTYLMKADIYRNKEQIEYLFRISFKTGGVEGTARLHSDWKFLEAPSAADGKYKLVRFDGLIKEFSWKNLPVQSENSLEREDQNLTDSTGLKLKPKFWLSRDPERLGETTWLVEAQNGLSNRVFITSHPLACLQMHSNYPLPVCNQCQKVSGGPLVWLEKQKDSLGQEIELRTFCSELSQQAEADAKQLWPFKRIIQFKPSQNFQEQRKALVNALSGASFAEKLRELIRLQSPKNWVFPEDVYLLSYFIEAAPSVFSVFEEKGDSLLSGAMQSLRVVNSAVYGQFQEIYPHVKVSVEPETYCRSKKDVGHIKAFGQK